MDVFPWILLVIFLIIIAWIFAPHVRQVIGGLLRNNSIDRRAQSRVEYYQKQHSMFIPSILQITGCKTIDELRAAQKYLYSVATKPTKPTFTCVKSPTPNIIVEWEEPGLGKFKWSEYSRGEECFFQYELAHMRRRLSRGNSTPLDAYHNDPVFGPLAKNIPALMGTFYYKHLYAQSVCRCVVASAYNEDYRGFICITKLSGYNPIFVMYSCTDMKGTANHNKLVIPIGLKRNKKVKFHEMILAFVISYCKPLFDSADKIKDDASNIDYAKSYLLSMIASVSAEVRWMMPKCKELINFPDYGTVMEDSVSFING